jgi:tetratricopeptide (TPR) repeat protein
MERKIYFKQEEIKLGCSSTAKATTVENYYQVVEIDEKNVQVQLLDLNDHPFGEVRLIEKEELKEYTSCPDYFKNKKSLKEQMVEKYIEHGDRHYENREFYSAEYEYNQALSLNDRHLKANLGKGKTLYAKGEKEEAHKVFNKLSNLDALYEVDNKHIFNEFGIELRKGGMFEEALSNYLKAISIDPSDEVLYYNLGRVYYEKKEHEKAIEQLTLALSLKPDFKEAQEFLSKIQYQ